MEGTNIRKAEVGDALALSKLVRENASHLLRPHYSDSQWTVFQRYYSQEAWTEKIGSQAIFCAVRESTIVGCIGLRKDFVVGFYTRLAYRNQGIGKLLMDHLESYAQKVGLTQLYLAASPEGLRFYFKNDWRKVRDFVVDHYGVVFNETLMVKKIGFP